DGYLVIGHLALTNMAVGRKATALALSKQAMNVVPLERDAVNGRVPIKALWLRYGSCCRYHPGRFGGPRRAHACTPRARSNVRSTPKTMRAFRSSLSPEHRKNPSAPLGASLLSILIELSAGSALICPRIEIGDV